MYGIVLWVHSWLRWAVLALGVAALARATLRRGVGSGWQPDDDRWGLAFVRVLGVQVLLGLALYLWLSPLARATWVDWGATLGDATLRFYAIEHGVGMLIGIAIAEGTRTRAARRERPARARTLALGWLLWLVVTLVSVPWPGLPYGRRLFRG